MKLQDIARIINSMHGLMPEGSRSMLAARFEHVILQNADEQYKQRWESELRQTFLAACRLEVQPAQDRFELLIERWMGITRYRDEGGWRELSEEQVILANTLCAELREFFEGKGVRELSEGQS